MTDQPSALIDLPEEVVLARYRPAILRAATVLLRSTSSYLDLEDLVQTGSVALLAALRTLPRQDARLDDIRYVWGCVRESLLHEADTTSVDGDSGSRPVGRPRKAPDPRAETLRRFITEDTDAPEGRYDQEATFLTGQLWSLAQRAICQLSDQERSALLLYYFRGATLREVGAALGVTQSRASQIHKSAILSLKNRLKRFE
jgi:RNA polymerase sigma factor (sigma-70 family)